MILNNENIKFLLQNNPEHVIIELIQTTNKLHKYIVDINNDIGFLRQSYNELDNKYKQDKLFFEWFYKKSFFKKLIWKIQKKTINDLYNKYDNETKK